MYWWLNDEKKPNTHPFLFSLGQNIKLEAPSTKEDNN